MAGVAEYYRKLGRIGNQPAKSSAVVLGFPGAGGRHIPMVAPPPQLFYCPAVLLLHDVIWIPDYVLDLDTKKTEDTVPYQLMDRLCREEVVQFLPCSDESALSELWPKTVSDAAEIVRILLANSLVENLSPPIIQRAFEEHEFPESWSREQLEGILHTFRFALDALVLHDLAEALGSPYSLVNDDYSVHEARHRRGGRELGSMVICGLHFPVAQWSILLDSLGASADLVPEAVLIQQHVMKGMTKVSEPGGLERSYRPPDEGRSAAALDRVLSLRERTEFKEMRKILREWRAEASNGGHRRRALARLAKRHQKHVNRLSPSVCSALGEMGEPAPILSLLIEEPELTPLARERFGPVASDPWVSQLFDCGSTPRLLGWSVSRG